MIEKFTIIQGEQCIRFHANVYQPFELVTCQIPSYRSARRQVNHDMCSKSVLKISSVLASHSLKPNFKLLFLTSVSSKISRTSTSNFWDFLQLFLELFGILEIFFSAFYEHRRDMLTYELRSFRPKDNSPEVDPPDELTVHKITKMKLLFHSFDSF